MPVEEDEEIEEIGHPENIASQKSNPPEKDQL